MSKQILAVRSANMPPLLFWEKGHMRTYQAGSGDREMYEIAIFQAERKEEGSSLMVRLQDFQICE